MSETMSKNCGGETASAVQREAKIFLYALIIALCLHLLIALLFKPPAAPEVKALAASRNIFMLSPSGKDSVLRKNIEFWLDCGDPTLFLKPNRPRGFSQTKKSVEAPPSLQEEPATGAVSEPQFQLATSSFQPFNPRASAASSRLWQPEALPTSPSNWQKAAAHPYPRWKTESGKSLDAQTMAIDAALAKRIMVLNPKKPSILLLRFSLAELLPRVSISQSCGVPELDEWAIKHVISLQERFRAKLGAEGESSLVIEWQKAEAL